MCVIITREPNVDIDFEKIKSACITNPDGYGIAISDRGKMTLIKKFNPKGNDPEEIFKLMEDAKGLPMAMHLRFSTVGEKNLDNCHPFLVMKNEEDGNDVVFMHNGTLYDFKKDKSSFSDSYHFAEEIVSPLLKMATKSGHQWDTLPIISSILNKYAGSSVFTLFDSEGHTMFINKFGNGAKDHGGWWSSNTYSFNRSHRSSTGVSSHTSRPTMTPAIGKPTMTNTKGGNTSTVNGSAQGNSSGTKLLPFRSKPNTIHTLHGVPSEMVPAIEKMKEELQKMGQRTVRTEDFGSTDFWEFVTTDRDNFMELIGLDDPLELANMDADELHSLIKDYPRVMTYVLIDILHDLYCLVFETEEEAEEETVVTKNVG